MAKPSLTVEGARELRKALRSVDGGTADLKAVHAEAAQIVERRAAQIVPKRSGDLGGTVRSSGTTTAGVVRAGFARVPYAGPIHFGWARRNISPQPFLYDALDKRRAEVIEAYETQVAGLIKKHGLN
jgi:hypothetical protein